MTQVETFISHGELVSQLSASIGATKANELVLSAAGRIGAANKASYNKTQALLIFETLAGMPGLVGIVARCAKARVILKFSNSPSRF